MKTKHAHQFRKSSDHSDRKPQSKRAVTLAQRYEELLSLRKMVQDLSGKPKRADRASTNQSRD
jgi:hypothetical protein